MCAYMYVYLSNYVHAEHGVVFSYSPLLRLVPRSASARQKSHAAIVFVNIRFFAHFIGGGGGAGVNPIVANRKPAKNRRLRRERLSRLRS